MHDSEDNIHSWGQDHEVGSNYGHERAARSRKEAAVLLGNVNDMAGHKVCGGRTDVIDIARFVSVPQSININSECRVRHVVLCECETGNGRRSTFNSVT